MLTPARGLVLFLVASATFISCVDDKAPEPPAYVLSEDSFAHLLVDFSLAESATSINVLMARGNQIDSLYAFDPLREKNISPAKYDSTLKYYARFPEQYKEVYQKVLTRLSALESARKTSGADTTLKK